MKCGFKKIDVFETITHAKVLKKLDSRSKKFIHIGYHLWDEFSQKIIYAHDVMFEEYFPQKIQQKNMTM